MQFIKVKFLKNGQPQGRGYTYKSEEELLPGDKVDLGGGRHGVVVDEPVDADWIKTYGADKVTVARKYVESVDVEEREGK